MPTARGVEPSQKEPTTKFSILHVYGLPDPLCWGVHGDRTETTHCQSSLNLNLETKFLWSFLRSGGFTKEEMSLVIHWIYGSIALRASLDVADKRKFLNPSGNRTKILRSCSLLHSPIRLTLPRLPILTATSSPVCYYNPNIHFNRRHKTISSTEW